MSKGKRVSESEAIMPVMLNMSMIVAALILAGNEVDVKNLGNDNEQTSTSELRDLKNGGQTRKWPYSVAWLLHFNFPCWLLVVGC